MKRKLYDDCIKYCNEAIELDHKHIKALYLKGKAFIEKTEYVKAIEEFKNILEIEDDNKDAISALQRAQKLYKQYEDKSAVIAKKMFS